MPDEYTEKTRLLVWTQSAGRCAFAGCGKALVLDAGSGDISLVGQMAHIVASSRQGPRGHDPLDSAARRDAANFIPCARSITSSSTTTRGGTPFRSCG